MRARSQFNTRSRAPTNFDSTAVAAAPSRLVSVPPSPNCLGAASKLAAWRSETGTTFQARLSANSSAKSLTLTAGSRDWRYKMRKVLSQRRLVFLNTFCPANERSTFVLAFMPVVCRLLLLLVQEEFQIEALQVISLKEVHLLVHELNYVPVNVMDHMYIF